MLKRLSVLLLLVASPCAAQTGTDEHREALQELMEVTHTREMTQKILDGMKASQSQILQQTMRPSMLQHGLSPAQIDQFFAVFWEEFDREFADFPDLTIAYSIKEWGQLFTHEEIVGLTAFYNTPLGAKVIQLTPEIATRAAIYGQKIGAEKGQRAAEAAVRRMNIK